MKIKLILVFTKLFIIGCKENHKHTFYTLLNDNFLTIVDTIAYKTGRIIQIPNDAASDLKFNNFCIEIDTALSISTYLSKSIAIALNKEHLTEFEALFLAGSNQNIDTLDLSRLTKTGKYKLYTHEKIKDCIGFKIDCIITFHRPYISSSKAIIPLTIIESKKGGYSKFYLFEKQNGIWKKIKEEITIRY